MLLTVYEHLYSPVAETHYTSKVRPKHKQAKKQLFKALGGLFCADVPLRNYSLTHSLA